MFLEATNSFGISAFSDTFNTLSSRIFELFYALNFATFKLLSFDIFLCYNLCYLHGF